MVVVSETKFRSLLKSIMWRIIAFLNSWYILSLSISESAFDNALFMNITGLFIFYVHERIWNYIHIGRYIT